MTWLSEKSHFDIPKVLFGFAMDPQLKLPTIHEDSMYQDQEEVQEKYFGRAQKKIVQGMTAKEKIPGKLSSFNIRKGVDITAVKSFSPSITEEDENVDQDLDIGKEKQTMVPTRIQRESAMKSLSPSIIEEDENVDEDLDVGKEKQSMAPTRIQRESAVKSFSLSMIEEDEEQLAEQEEEECQMPKQQDKLLDVSRKQEATPRVYAKEIGRPYNGQTGRYGTNLSNEHIPYKMKPERGMMENSLSSGERGGMIEEGTGGSRVHILEQELMEIEKRIKEKSELLSMNAKSLLTEQDYRNLLREMMCKADMSLENGKGQKGQKMETVPKESDVHEKKIGDNKGDGERDGHILQKRNRKARTITNKTLVQNECVIDAKEMDMKLRNEKCLKSDHSVHPSDVKPSAKKHVAPRQKEVKHKSHPSTAELFANSPYAESMRCNGVNLPRIKPCSKVPGEPIFPAAQKRHGGCKLPPIQNPAKVSQSAIYSASDSSHSTPVSMAQPMRPRTQAGHVAGPPPSRRSSSQNRSLSRTPTSTPSTPKITPPLMTIPQTFREIRNHFHAPKRQAVMAKMAVAHPCNILVVDSGSKQPGRNSSNNCALSEEGGVKFPPLIKLTSKSQSYPAENERLGKEVADNKSRDTRGRAEKVSRGRRHGQQ